MLLSTILKEFLKNNEYKITNEKAFDTLAIIASETNYESCVFLDDERYLKKIKENMVMVLTNEQLGGQIKEYYKGNKGICVVEEPRQVFFSIHNYLENSMEYIRKNFSTRIGDGCKISSLACIASNNVVIGNNVTIEEFAVIRANTEIGDNSIIRAGVKIGGQGFEYKRIDNGILSVMHFGGVKIGKNVEIQYNSCVDRAIYPWDNTVVGDNTKIDNLVYLAHGVKICNNVLIVAQSGVGGRTIIESNAWIGLSATIRNGIRIGKGSRANIGAVVTKNIEDEQAVSGNFAIDHTKFIENIKNTIHKSETER